MKHLVLAGILVCALGARAETVADGDGAEKAFKRGAQLMEKGRFKEAIPFLKEAEKVFSDNSSVLWNLGLASAEVQNHRDALSCWQKYCRFKPGDWMGIAKLVQAYQALGDFNARDREIKELYARRAASKDSDLAKTDRFCREQFVVAGKKVFAFEIFEPRGERRIFYRFAILDSKTGDETSFISLGSYDGTTQIARELGEIAESERIYHIDRYAGSAHESFAFFKAKPSYGTVREIVEEIMSGKAKAIAGSR